MENCKSTNQKDTPYFWAKRTVLMCKTAFGEEVYFMSMGTKQATAAAADKLNACIRDLQDS